VSFLVGTKGHFCARLRLPLRSADRPSQNEIRRHEADITLAKDGKVGGGIAVYVDAHFRVVVVVGFEVVEFVTKLASRAAKFRRAHETERLVAWQVHVGVESVGSILSPCAWLKSIIQSASASKAVRERESIRAGAAGQRVLAGAAVEMVVNEHRVGIAV
jgi:hypothetical protein